MISPFNVLGAGQQFVSIISIALERYTALYLHSVECGSTVECELLLNSESNGTHVCKVCCLLVLETSLDC